MNGEFDVRLAHLETERLWLRPWRESDVDDFYEYASVDGVGQMAGWIPHESRQKSMEILCGFMRSNDVFAIEYKENDKVIGSLGVHQINGLDDSFACLFGREIGYVLSKDYWGKGLMPEAARAVIDYCFHDLNYDFLLCGYFLWNQQSRRVNEKLGFQFYKEINFETRYHTVERTALNILWNPARRIEPCSNC